MTTDKATVRRTAQKVVKPLLLLAAIYHLTPCLFGAVLVAVNPDHWEKVLPILLRTAALWLLWWLMDDPDETAAAAKDKKPGAAWAR